MSASGGTVSGMDDFPREDPSADTDPGSVEERALAAKQERLQLTAGQRDLVEEVSAFLFRADPAGINFGSNTDEYESEAESIVIGLPQTSEVQDVAELAQRVFTVWFDADTAGPAARYETVAVEIWDAWRSRRGGDQVPG